MPNGYRNEPVSKRDVGLLLKKRQLVESELKIKIDGLMFISRSGFTEASFNNEVWCVDSREINELLSKLDMRQI